MSPPSGHSANTFWFKYLYLLEICFSFAKANKLIEIFFKDSPNRVKLLERLERTIQSTVRLGFLKETERENTEADAIRYEVRRIVKARLTIEKLEEIKRKLQLYAEVSQEEFRQA